jgi:L-ascorbate metabolism protein UlaG (beta-lactamase superfamily)
LPQQLVQEQPDVVLVPINGHDPSRGVAGNLNGTEAAALAKACGAALAIPHHFDMFAFNTATPDEFTAACTRLNQPHRVLRCGERVTFPS